mmetsp:Transcript_19499/g.52518  ORF Transcript_19499/g.52518 Transcript_19499/m.52518 type:complete len:358 (+) Transcript_19499:425-1498(+)
MQSLPWHGGAQTRARRSSAWTRPRRAARARSCLCARATRSPPPCSCGPGRSPTSSRLRTARLTLSTISIAGTSGATWTSASQRWRACSSPGAPCSRAPRWACSRPSSAADTKRWPPTSKTLTFSSTRRPSHAPTCARSTRSSSTRSATRARSPPTHSPPPRSPGAGPSNLFADRRMTAAPYPSLAHGRRTRHPRLRRAKALKSVDRRARYTVHSSAAGSWPTSCSWTMMVTLSHFSRAPRPPSRGLGQWKSTTVYNEPMFCQCAMTCRLSQEPLHKLWNMHPRSGTADATGAAQRTTTTFTSAVRGSSRVACAMILPCRHVVVRGTARTTIHVGGCLPDSWRWTIWSCTSRSTLTEI